jgi:8-oxo-dGTP diphosphatase
LNTRLAPETILLEAAGQAYRPDVGVHLILVKDSKVLLIQRQNTGFADGYWSTPGGCLDEGETLPAGAAREAREELGININYADLSFAHLCHHADPDGQARIGVFFLASRWTGQPVNAEPAKCASLGWFDTDDLPDNIVTYAFTGIQGYRRGEAFTLDSWTNGEHPGRHS